MSCDGVLLEVRGLSKSYRLSESSKDRVSELLSLRLGGKTVEYPALSDVSFTARRGEALAIIGRNGSGKSTLLQLVAGTLAPTAGQVQAFGRVAALLELGAGFNHEFTGRENVYIAGSALGLSESEIERKLGSIIEFASIGDFIDQPVKVYSSGMFARLAFSVAAHVEADILIIDEILGVGDAAFFQKCMRFIRSFKKTGLLIFVSHDPSSVVALCERALWLDAGQVRMEGDAKDVVHNYTAALQQERVGETFKIGGRRKASPFQEVTPEDQRHKLISDSHHQNRIEVFSFDPDAPWFGERGAEISSVSLESAGGGQLGDLLGGEELAIRVTCKANQTIDRPIVGFYVKNNLGQALFGDNTFLSYEGRDIQVQSGEVFEGLFEFRMPYLPNGDYSISAAVAEGTQVDHVHHHWVDDALFFRVTSGPGIRGLVGIPMKNIEFKFN